MSTEFVTLNPIIISLPTLVMTEYEVMREAVGETEPMEKEPENPPEPITTAPIPTSPSLVEQRITKALKDSLIVFGEGSSDLQYAFLDNDYQCAFEFGGLQYRCATAAYEAQKLFHKPELMEKFTTLNAKDALALSAEKHLDKYPSWYVQRESSMLDVLRAKFGQNPKLLRDLLLTADAYLSFYTPYKGMDPFWTNNADGTGENRLGRALMRIRKDYGGMEEPQPPAQFRMVREETKKSINSSLDKLDSQIRAEIGTLNSCINDEDYQRNSWTARNPSTHNLTRFPNNNFPYDKTLVSLSSGRFINASFIFGKQFIGTQSPLPHTAEDFWSMVLEHNAAIVIMLNRLGDPGDHIYFPFALEDKKCFGRIHLELAEPPLFNTEPSWRQAPHEEEPHAVIQRKINICQDQENPRQIHHFQYQNWRDMSAGNERATAYLIKEVHKLRQENPESPVIIHCHAGVGRTSVVVTLLDQYHAFCTSGELNIMRSVERQRSPLEGRCNSMMQSSDQYAFCYRVLRLLT